MGSSEFRVAVASQHCVMESTGGYNSASNGKAETRVKACKNTAFSLLSICLAFLAIVGALHSCTACFSLIFDPVLMVAHPLFRHGLTKSSTFLIVATLVPAPTPLSNPGPVPVLISHSALTLVLILASRRAHHVTSSSRTINNVCAMLITSLLTICNMTLPWANLARQSFPLWSTCQCWALCCRPS